MNDRKTVRPGDEIIIRIEQREKPISTATAQNAPKAMIRVRRPADFLPRRINGGGGINFYDLAQKKNGDGWATIPASIAKAEGDAFFDDFTDASKADLKTQTENQIFAVPFSEWKNVFFKIKKGDDFARLIRVRYDEHGAPAGNTLDALDRWENGGLRLSADEAATFGFVGEQSGLFASFGTSPPVLSQPDQLYKITAERRADASSVPFTPSRKLDVFLLPAAATASGFANYRNGRQTIGTAQDFIYYRQDFGGAAAVVDRALYRALRAIQTNPALSAYQKKYRATGLLHAFPLAVTVSRRTDLNGTTRSTLGAAAFPPPEVFTPDVAPVPDYTYPPEAALTYEGFDLPGGVQNYSVEFGFNLAAVLMQNEQVYYLWRT